MLGNAPHPLLKTLEGRIIIRKNYFFILKLHNLILFWLKGETCTKVLINSFLENQLALLNRKPFFNKTQSNRMSEADAKALTFNLKQNSTLSIKQQQIVFGCGLSDAEQEQQKLEKKDSAHKKRNGTAKLSQICLLQTFFAEVFFSPRMKGDSYAPFSLSKAYFSALAVRLGHIREIFKEGFR